MKELKLKITLTEEMLGTGCSNPDVHKEFIASKSADAAKMEEELAALPADVLEQKAKTIFSRDTDGTPILFDYQVKGFLKETVGILIETPDFAKEILVGKTRLTKYSFKRIVDNYVFVTPRKIRLCPSVGVDCVRPLRAITPRGERVSLVTSETVPAGTNFECGITTLSGGEEFDKLIEACLNFGALKGLGQWRNSGKGRFSWEKVV